MDPYGYPPANAPAAPAPPAESYGPPPEGTYGGPIQPQPRKNRTVLIIVLVVVGLLVCCCISTAIGLVFVARSDSDVSTLGEDFVGGIVGDEAGSTDLGTGDAGTGETDAGTSDAATDAYVAPDTGWEAFMPGPYDAAVFSAPSERNIALVQEIHAQLYPDFTVDEVLCEPGYIEGDTFWEDQLFVKASLASDPAVQIAYVLYIELQEAFEQGVSYDPADIESYLTLTTSANGTEYIYNHSRMPGLLNGISDPAVVGLLAQSQADFPGSVADYVEIDGDQGYLTLTRWEAYPAYVGGFDVTYTRMNGGWEYVSSQQW